MSYWMSKCRRETVGCMNVARRGQSVLGIEMYRWNLKMTSRWDFLAYSFPLDAVTNWVHTRGLIQQKRILSIWRPEVHSQGVCRAAHLLEPTGESPVLIVSGFWCCQQSLTAASGYTSPSSISLVISLPLLSVKSPICFLLFFYSLKSIHLGHAVEHAGSWVPNQGSNLSHSAMGVQSLNHWTTTEVPPLCFSYKDICHFSLLGPTWISQDDLFISNSLI